MAKTTPLSVRLDSGTDNLIRDIAHREGRSRSAVVADMLSESARVRMFPGIGFKGGGGGRRAYVLGSGYDVWQIVDLVNDCDKQKALDDFGLIEHQVQVALAYYESFQSEIDARIEANRIGIEKVRKLYPGLVIDEIEIQTP